LAPRAAESSAMFRLIESLREAASVVAVAMPGPYAKHPAR
jgi:hypothetical protein